MKVVLIGGSDSKIYIPYLDVKYTEKAIDTSSGLVQYPDTTISYMTEYSHESKTFWAVAIVFFIIMNLIILFILYVKMRIWMLYNPKEIVKVNDTNYYVQFLLALLQYFSDLWAQGTFWIMFIFTGYWFVFFKLQSKAYVLMPSLRDQYKENYQKFDNVFYAAFAFCLLSIILLIKKQTSIDVFFIDWEEKKEFIDRTDMGRGRNIWRVLFMANEFNELSVVRVVNIEFTLIAMGFFMAGLKWDQLQAEMPEMTTNTRNVQLNYVLGYFMNTFMFFVIGLVQILINRIMVCKLPMKIQEYMDLCTVANVSIFILEDDLHGKRGFCCCPRQAITPDTLLPPHLLKLAVPPHFTQRPAFALKNDARLLLARKGSLENC